MNIIWVALTAGLFAQLVDGIAGMGFGVVSSTILVGFGIAPAIASASIHTAEVATTLCSGISHWKFGNIKKEWLYYLAIPGALGGICGALLLTSIKGNVSKPWVAGLLLLLGILIIYRFSRRKVSTPKHVPKKLVSVLGFVAAFVDAIGGGGWGPIATPGLIISSNEEPRKVIGTVNLTEFIVTIAIALTFIIKLGSEEYNWPLVGAFALGGVVMAPLAAYLTKKVSSKKLGLVAGGIVVIYNLRTLLKVFGIPLP